MKNSLGSKISALRNEKGITQKELADLCSIDIRTIQRIESSEVTPRKHTLKLIANILGAEISYFQNSHEDAKIDMTQIRLCVVGGLVFSVNYIPVVFNLIVGSFNVNVHLAMILIHIVSCVLFFKGFYLLGQRCKNQLIIISSLFAMILLPLLNILDLLKEFYFLGNITYAVFTWACVNAIIFGTGLLVEGAKNFNSRMNLYTIAGIITIAQSGLFMSSRIDLIYVGLVISALCNFITLTILYSAYKQSEKIKLKQFKIPQMN